MLKQVEDAMIAKLRAALGSSVKEIDTLPAQLDDAELGRRIRNAPGAYVAFIGGEARSMQPLVIDATFAVYVITASTQEADRRRGSSAQAGAYLILIAAAATLHNHQLKGIGTLECAGIDNLFAEALDAKGVSLYAVRFKIPLTVPEGDADLADFLNFHADWLLAPHAAPEDIELPYDEADAQDDARLTPARTDHHG